MWRLKTGSTLVQVMACCLSAPSHYWTDVDLPSGRSRAYTFTFSKSIEFHSKTVFQLKQIYVAKIKLFQLTCLDWIYNFYSSMINTHGFISFNIRLQSNIPLGKIVQLSVSSRNDITKYNLTNRRINSGVLFTINIMPIVQYRYCGRRHGSIFSPASISYYMLYKVCNVISENIKIPRHWSFWGPLTNSQQPGKCFHLTASSWNIVVAFIWLG